MRKTRECQRRGAWWRARVVSLSLARAITTKRALFARERVYALGEEEERKEKISAEESFGVENFVFIHRQTV